LDIRHDMLRRWIKEYSQKKNEVFNGTGLSKSKDKKLSELHALKKELRETKLERDILKTCAERSRSKAIHIFSKSDGTNIDLS
jgi:transposase-like protein